jgi:hypothetical protein
MQALPRIALWLAFAGALTVVGLLLNRLAGPHWYPDLYVTVSRVGKISSLSLFCLAALLAAVHWRTQGDEDTGEVGNTGGRG